MIWTKRRKIRRHENLIQLLLNRVETQGFEILTLKEKVNSKKNFVYLNPNRPDYDNIFKELIKDLDTVIPRNLLLKFEFEIKLQEDNLGMNTFLNYITRYIHPIKDEAICRTSILGFNLLEDVTDGSYIKALEEDMEKNMFKAFEESVKYMKAKHEKKE